MAAGYRLAGEVLDHVCCRHLYGVDRMLTVWPAIDHAVVIAVGHHDESAQDVYAALLEALELDVLADEREKPPCWTTRAYLPLTRRSQRPSARPSSSAPVRGDEPADFYRNFYRTG